MSERKALLLVTMEPSAGMEDEFNDWYDHEHFSQRMALPGFETGSRWACLDGWPRWLAIYDLSSRAVLETESYLAVSTANATPWSRRIAARTTGRSRIVADQIAPGMALTGQRNEVSRLLLARYSETALPAETFATLAGKAVADVPGLLQARVFRSAQDGAAQLWLLAEFGRPVTLDALIAAAGDIEGHGASLFNLYAPYWRS